MSEVLPMQMVCEMAKNLPCSPWLLPKIVKLLDNSSANAKDLENMIIKDSGLAAAILRMANSSYFAGAMQCESLSDAILRLGFKELYRVTASSIAGRWLSNEVTGGYGWEPGDLSKHSLCVAVASELLAKDSLKIKPELAYTAGLLHDVGKLALAYACTEQFETIRQYQLQANCSWRESEHSLLGYDHCDIGGALLQAWACPINLVQVACYYSRPKLAGPDSLDLVVHIHAAKHLAIQIGLGVGEEGFKTELDEEMLVQHGYTEELFMNKLPTILIETEKVIAGIDAPKEPEEF